MSEDEPTVADRAVSRYREAEKGLNEFLKDENVRELFQEYDQLVQEFNQTLDQAMRALKTQLRTSDQTKLVIDGLGAQKKFKRWYDTTFLANALPAEQSDLILTEKIVYDLDTDRLEQLLRQGEIDNDTVQKAYRETEQNPANMPGTPKAYVIPAMPMQED